MKPIPFIVSFLFVSIFVISLDAQSNSKLYTINKDLIDIKFTTAYSFNDLVQLRDILKKENIDLSYTLLELDKKGNLQKISASIEYDDGLKASFSSRLLQPGDGPGFHRDYLKERNSKR